MQVRPGVSSQFNVPRKYLQGDIQQTFQSDVWAPHLEPNHPATETPILSVTTKVLVFLNYTMIYSYYILQISVSLKFIKALWPHFYWYILNDI